jgi:transposase-like protein
LVDIFPKGNTMSKPMADTPKRRARRQFTDEFKASAVRLVLDEGKTVSAAARDLDLTETALREWVKRARADRTHGRTGLTTAERSFFKIALCLASFFLPRCLREEAQE